MYRRAAPRRRSTREKARGGIKAIERAVLRLQQHHSEHIEAYGSGNHRRLTGEASTQQLSKQHSGWE